MSEPILEDILKILILQEEQLERVTSILRRIVEFEEQQRLVNESLGTTLMRLGDALDLLAGRVPECTHDYTFEETTAGGYRWVCFKCGRPMTGLR